MTTQDLIDRLAEHKTLGAAPRIELEWLAAHGSLRKLNTDEVLSLKGVQVEALYAILSGRLALFVDRGSGLNKIVEWRGGDVAGMLPYSRLMAPPGNSVALEPSEVLAIPREHLEKMARECFNITSILVHNMIDRARMFTTNDLHNEKMISLGKLSAGLAHELNNPASAIERCSATLEDYIGVLEEASRALAATTLSDAQIATVNAVRLSCTSKQPCEARSPLEQSDREEAIVDWLDDHGLDVTNAQMLAETEVTVESLNMLADTVEKPTLNTVIRWAAAGCAVRNLASRIQESATRISSMVTAVKGFTNMDHAIVAEPVALGPGLNNTVTVLASKAREKSVTVTLKLEPELPKVCGFSGELNQIWGNLIENALDAVPNGGCVEVSAASENRNVVVRILDNGPGIPTEIRDLIFDPFFTTKPMGQGTGLGLHIVRSLVRHNDGTIHFESQPGRTEFRVSLPIAKN